MTTALAPLRVGVDSAPPPPMCHGLPGDADFEGFEVDLMHALAGRLGRPLAFHASLWTELLERLQAGELDLICTAATITPERERRFLFSEPYLRNRLAAISRRADPVLDLTGFGGRVGVREGTPAEAYAVDRGVQPLRFHFNEEVYSSLEQRALDAVVDDFPIGAWFAARSSALQAAPLDGTDTLYGLVLRRDAADLKAAVDEALRAAVADGTYDDLYERWMKPLVGDVCDVTAGANGSARILPSAASPRLR